MRHLRKQMVYSVASVMKRSGFGFNSMNNPQVLEMLKAIDDLDNKAVSFAIEQHPDGHWSAVSTNVDGIMTGGDDPRQVPEFTKDAIFTYFEVPTQYCDETLLRNDNEPARVKQNIHVGA